MAYCIEGSLNKHGTELLKPQHNTRVDGYSMGVGMGEEGESEWVCRGSRERVSGCVGGVGRE